MADFCVSGRSPDCKEALQISRAKLALDPTNSVYSSQATSSTLTSSKLDNGVATSCFLITGGGALEVEARILSTFDVKNAAKSSAEKWLES
jgi:hypothetical protein